MKEEKWGTVKEFVKHIPFSPGTVHNFIAKGCWPKDMAIYDYGRGGYGSRSYKIKVGLAVQFLREHPGRFGLGSKERKRRFGII
jgi:hypothetical protein